MLQYMREGKVEVALVSEPNRVPGGNWLGDASGLAAVHWGTDEPCSLIERGWGYVFIEYKQHVLGSCYCSPNVDTNTFRRLLENVENVVSGVGARKILIGGDFNARSRGWDRKYNERGYILDEWINGMDLVVLNEGRVSTCVRAQGSSVVDITIGTEMAARGVSSWEVDAETETLSDHRYVRIGIEEGNKRNKPARGKIFPRWNLKKIERDWFITSVMCGRWLKKQHIGEIENAERVLKRIVTDACNNSMKRERGGRGMKGKVYWWSTEIAEIRGRCNMWRRRLVRAKGRNNQEREAQLAGELKNSRKELRRAIGNAKKKAWDELLEGLSRDPWGRPYKMVMNKIKSDNVNIGEKLSTNKMEEILSKLFPKDRGKFI